MKRPAPADSSNARDPSTLEAMEGCRLGAADGARNSASAPNQFRWVKGFERHHTLPHSPLVAGDAASACSGCGTRLVQYQFDEATPGQLANNPSGLARAAPGHPI